MDRLGNEIKTLRGLRSQAIKKAFSLGIRWVEKRPFQDLSFKRGEWVALNDEEGRVCNMIDVSPGISDEKWIYCEIERGYNIPDHVHPDFAELLFVVSGSLTLCVEGKFFTLNSHDAYDVPQGVIHSADYHDDTRLMMILSPQL